MFNADFIFMDDYRCQLEFQESALYLSPI